MIKEVLCQDLQEHCGTDKATFDLINMIKFSDQVHEGNDEETMSLVNQLNNETIAEEKKVNQATAKTNSNPPSLSQNKKAKQ